MSESDNNFYFKKLPLLKQHNKKVDARIKRLEKYLATPENERTDAQKKEFTRERMLQAYDIYKKGKEKLETKKKTGGSVVNKKQTKAKKKKVKKSGAPHNRLY